MLQAFIGLSIIFKASHASRPNMIMLLLLIRYEA